MPDFPSDDFESAEFNPAEWYHSAAQAAQSHPDNQETDGDPVDSSDDAIPESVVSEQFQPWIERLKRSDRSFYNLMALEVWSLARTMDDLVPGFWSRFMENRQAGIKQFVQYHKMPPPNHEEPPEQQEP